MPDKFSRIFWLLLLAAGVMPVRFSMNSDT